MSNYYNYLTRLEMERLDRKNTIVMIPLGATEQHGNQAPLGTDAILADDLVKYVFRELDDDFPLLAFPTIPVGLSLEHHHFCGSISFEPDTYYHMLKDIIDSLYYHGFRKIVFLICHGGNRPVIELLTRKLRIEYDDILPFMISSGSFNRPEVKATISEGNNFDFHGGEMETSMVMANHPELVKLDTSVSGKPNKYLDKQYVKLFGGTILNWISDDFVDENSNPIGIGGDPSGATSEKGEIILKCSAEDIAKTLIEIKNW